MIRRVIPTVLVNSKEEFDERLAKLLPIAEEIQIDLMDGEFVENKSIDLYDLPNLKKYKKDFEAHLMVENPGDYIKTLKEKGFSKIIFHYESLKSNSKIKSLIQRIKDLGMKAFIALNPETETKEIFGFLHLTDGILFMGVNPGKEKQEFIPGVYKKVREIERFNPGIITQVDGGVDLHVAKELGKIGVDIINSGSFVSDSRNPKQALFKLGKCFFE